MRILRGMVLGTTMALVLGACANTGLRDLRSDSGGPDEFQIQTVKPLEQPQDVTVLPPPTPGGSNLVDHKPFDDVSIALGGRAPSSPDAPVPGVDGAMVTHASRFGVSPDIRQSLAAEDAKFRKQRGRFTNIRIVRTDMYNKVYERYALDPVRVSQSFRRAGIQTPSSPP